MIPEAFGYGHMMLAEFRPTGGRAVEATKAPEGFSKWRYSHEQ